MLFASHDWRTGSAKRASKMAQPCKRRNAWPICLAGIGVSLTVGWREDAVRERAPLVALARAVAVDGGVRTAARKSEQTEPHLNEILAKFGSDRSSQKIRALPRKSVSERKTKR
jgi:hypothetical protein